MRTLSEQLKMDHECGDFGNALAGYSERAAAIEALIPFVVHGGLYCYEECECGLDALTDAAGLPRCGYFPT